jgi:hypothetical protein
MTRFVNMRYGNEVAHFLANRCHTSIHHNYSAVHGSIIGIGPIPMALEIDYRDLTNRVCRGEVCTGYLFSKYILKTRFTTSVILTPSVSAS